MVVSGWFEATSDQISMMWAGPAFCVPVYQLLYLTPAHTHSAVQAITADLLHHRNVLPTRNPARAAADIPPIEAFRYVEAAAGRKTVKKSSVRQCR